MKSGSGRLVSVRWVMSLVGLCQLQHPQDLQEKQKTAHTYIWLEKLIPMSFPYNQLSTCPTDNSSPLWVLFGPKPLQMPIYCCPNPWPVQSEQKYLGQRLACLAVTPTHLPWNHSLHSLHWTMSLPSTLTSIPALVRPTTSSYTKAGTFRA